MEDDEDYYTILEVSPNATKEEISRAHKKLALQLHPDKNYSSDTVAAFQKVQGAYDELKDDRKRQIYDASRSFRRQQDAALEAVRRRRERRTASPAQQEALRREASRRRDQYKQQTAGGHATLQKPLTVQELREMHRREKAAREAARQAEQSGQISPEEASSQSSTREAPTFQELDVQQPAHDEPPLQEGLAGEATQGQPNSPQRPDTPVPQPQVPSSNEQRDQSEQQATVNPVSSGLVGPSHAHTTISNPPHYSSHSFALPTVRHRRAGSDPPHYNTHSFYQPRLDSRGISQPITALEASIQALEEAQRVQEDTEQTPEERLARMRQWKVQKSRHYFDRLQKYKTKKGVLETKLAEFERIMDEEQAEFNKTYKQIDKLKAEERKELNTLDIRKYTNWYPKQKLCNNLEFAALCGRTVLLDGHMQKLMDQIEACEHELKQERLAYETEEHNARTATVKEVRTYLTQPGTEEDSRPWGCRVLWKTLGEVEMPANFFLPNQGDGTCVGTSHDMILLVERKWLSAFKPVLCARCNKSVRGREVTDIKSAKCSKCDFLVCGICNKWMAILREYEEYLEGREGGSIFDFENF